MIVMSLLCHFCSRGPEPSGQVSTRTFNYPVLKGKKDNPVLRISLENKSAGSGGALFSLRLAGTDQRDVDSLRIYYTGSDSLFGDEILFGQAAAARKKTRIPGQYSLGTGTHYFWVSCELSQAADLLSRISLSLDYLLLADQKLFPVTVSGVPYARTGVAVQLSDGRIMLNMRDNRNRTEKGSRNGRAVATTSDLGETWQEHETSYGALIECVCMASIHKHAYRDREGNPKSLLLFSNPNSKFTRHKQTIKASFDDGLTWPEKYWIELDEGRGSGYSCLTSVDEETIGILYEGSQAHMTFQIIDIKEWLDP
jgi:hypothetical protein